MTLQETWLEPVLLYGKHIRLEPLDPIKHAAAMFEFYDATATTFLGPSISAPIESVEAMIVHLEQQRSRPNRVNWAVRILGSNAVAGRVVFADVQIKHLSLELGTLLMPAFWGSVANVEAKLLLMTRVFEVLGANRVQFTVEAENLRSIAALQKMGITKEGVRRQCQIRLDGSVCDLVLFSVIKSEWASVKAHLEARANGV